jgi:hypothetical protein
VVGQQNVIISHLQYDDETLCVEEATVEKSLDFEGYSLRFWDMVLGLKVNFAKSWGLIGTHPFLD